MVCFILFCILGALCLFYIYRKCTQKPIIVRSKGCDEVHVRPFLVEDTSKVRSDARSNPSKTISSKPTESKPTKISTKSVQHNTYLFEDVSLNSEKSSSMSSSNYTHEGLNYSGSGRFGGGGSSDSWGGSSSDRCSSSSDSGSSSSSSCD